MDQLKWLQIISNLMYFSTIGYPVILMMIRADTWKKRTGRDIRTAIYGWVYFMLIIQSSLWERNVVTVFFLMFALLPMILLFHYQKKEYEPTFIWWEHIKVNKWIAVVFLVLLVGQWLVNRMIAGSVLEAHHNWVTASMMDGEIKETYNLYRISGYEGEIHEYLIQYDPDDVQISNYSGTQINYRDAYGDSIVTISYRLEGIRWQLIGIDIIKNGGSL